MASFVIAGKPDCPATVHAMFVARYLERQLPKFKLRILQMRTGDWEYYVFMYPYKDWLANLNWTNEWHVSCCPVIWKEIVEIGSRPHLIGCVSEFWEYCYDYYGLESLVTPVELEQMVADNMQYYEFMQQKKAQEDALVRNVLISGAANSMIIALLPELLEVPNIPVGNNLKISLYDSYSCKKLKFMKEIVQDIIPLAGQTISIVEQRKEVLRDCDLLLIIDDFSKRPDESDFLWLRRNRSEMVILGDEINSFAKRELRVVFACNGPICFNATVLTHIVTTIRIRNIVAVTSDRGLAPLSVISKELNVPIEQLCGPPVWGFVGINEYIDIDNSLINTDMLLPYQRSVHNNGESTLTQGVIVKELRKISYLTDNIENFDDKVSTVRDIVTERLDRQPTYSKVRATISLLKLWYSKTPNDIIISLGIFCTGPYNFPKRIVFSQLVQLDNRIWRAFTNIPMTKKTERIIKELSIKTLDILEELNQELPEAECLSI